MMRSTSSLVALAAALSLGVVACKGGGGASPSPSPAAGGSPAAQAGGVQITEEARAQAKEIFAQRCATCHGDQGAGDGAASAGLNPKPRNLQSPEWQKSVTDQHIETIILKGGPSVGMSPLMPPNPDLEGKPAVVAALRELVRSFGKQ